MASRRPDLHLSFVERGVGAGAAGRRPVAHCVGAVLLEQMHRRDDVALRLRHLLAVGVENPAGKRGVASTAGSPCSRCARTTVEKSHVRMMSWPCGRRSIGKVRANKSASALPLAGDLWGQRRGGPRVHDVGVADEAVRLAPLVFAVSGRALSTTGRSAGLLRPARAGRSHTGSPSPSSAYHSGIGTPKKRCRLTSQSPLRPLTHES